MKEYLSNKGVSFKELNVAEDTAARQEMVDKTHSMAVPTSIVNGQVIVGFNKEKLEKLIH